MNVRKPIDYSAMYAALNTLMAASLPQMKLYCEIGKLINARPEKGAAVSAAEYLGKAYPDAKGFSPRNLRRMRDFYRAYEDAPGVLVEAMTIGWTQNAVILENCKSFDEQVWYIRAVRQFGWTKSELLENIRAGAYLEISLNLADDSSLIKEKAANVKSMADNRCFYYSLRQGSDEKIRLGDRVRGNKHRTCPTQLSDRQGPDQPPKQNPHLQWQSPWKPPPVGYPGSR